MARRFTARPLPAWVGDLPVFERELSNGFRALVLPRKHAPVIVCDLFYPVGSANEPAGKSGLAHFLEHMLFKGTERLPKGQIDCLAFQAAGHTNAETGEDCTHYWFALPRDRWELALAIEADRMTGAAFDPREVEAERFVIAEERAHEQDSPAGRLELQHLAMSYLVHPYRNPILGWPEEVRAISVADLASFYETHYRPDGAVLVVVGDLDPQRALDRITTHFDSLPRGTRNRSAPPPAEPRQVGRREFVLFEPEGVPRGLFGWHSVPFGHPDGPALSVLSDLLTCGRRSRLWDRLVERDRLATWVDSSQEGSRLAGQFLIQVEAVPGADPRRLEAAILEEFARLAALGPTSVELMRSRSRLEAAWRWEQDDTGGLAAGLGQVALWGDWRLWQVEHRAALAVTSEDIRRVTAAYLVDSGLTVGWSLPRPSATVPLVAPSQGLAWTSGQNEARPAAPPIVEAPVRLVVVTGASTLADFQPRRTHLANGLRLIVERRSGTGTVALELHADAGMIREAKPGLAHLTGRLREEGTARLSAEELAEAIEDVGGLLDVTATGASLRVRSEDLPLAVELLADVTLRPAFPASALSWTKKRIAAELRADRDDPVFRAESAFRRLVYQNHPSSRDPRGNLSQIQAINLDDVWAHHRRFFTPNNAFLVAVGDFDPRHLRRLVQQHFGTWEASGSKLAPPPQPVPLRRAMRRRLIRPGEQVHILLGHLGIPRKDRDFDALAVLDHILGCGPGFTDRLSRVLRDEMGLVYSVGGGFCESADTVAGLFRIYAGTSPQTAERAAAIIRDEIVAMHRGDFSNEEVARARDYLAGSWVFDYQSVTQRAERLLELEHWGLPLDEPLRWPDRISRVSPAAVKQAARRHIHPDRLILVETGPA